MARPRRLVLAVPRAKVKEVKSALERHGRLDRSVKIRPCRREKLEELGRDQGDGDGSFFRIPTTVESDEQDAEALLESIGLSHLASAIRVLLSASETEAHQTSGQAGPARTKGNPLTATINDWLRSLPPDLLASLDLSAADLLAGVPTTYSIYKPMLLLPPTTFQTPAWRALSAALEGTPHLPTLYARLAAALDVTHIAINAPIPPQSSTSSSSPTTTANILRSPIYLHPLHGSFGPAPPIPHPSPSDLTATLWVRTTQHGIHQTWAPQHTMFSRGNITEKARIRSFPSVRCDPAAGPSITAVDLYAGIGYFAFSYAAGEGVGKVLGWEINPWSVEGLRRGARANGWGCRVFGEGEEVEPEVEATPQAQPKALAQAKGSQEEAGEKLWIFHESNAHALRRIERLRPRLPPVRHVNCGLLPSSRASWRTAVRALDPGLGGWVHVHENVAVGEIERKAGEVVDVMGGLVGERRGEMGEGMEEGEGMQPVLEHVERVKTYAPGVMHVVLDIWIPPVVRRKGEER